MSEPTSALTFYDLILRIAERAGMAYYGTDGQGKALIPIDAYNLDRCKRIVNDGIKMFIAHPPSGGWRWQRRMASVLLYPDGSGTDNIDSDAARYLLPQHFAGQVDGPINYLAETNHSTVITWTHPSIIDERRSVTVTTGYPTLAAYRPYAPASAPALASNRRWELLLDPQPSAADTLIFPYTVYFDRMDLEAGLASDGSPTTLVDGTYRDEADDYFNGWLLTIIAGTGKGETATITDYTGSTGTFTFTALSGGSTPDDTSVYYVQPALNLHPAGIAFDYAILSACKAQIELQVEQINEGFNELFFKVDLPSAYNLDKLTAPRKVGNFYGKGAAIRERTWDDVTTDHDI